MKKVIIFICIAVIAIITAIFLISYSNSHSNTTISVDATKETFKEIEKQTIINRLENENIKISCFSDMTIDNGSDIYFQNINAENEINITFKVYENGSLLYESRPTPAGTSAEWRIHLSEGVHDLTVMQEPYYIKGDINIPLSKYQYKFKLTVM